MIEKRSTIKQALKNAVKSINQREYWSEDYREHLRPDKTELFKRYSVPTFKRNFRNRGWA